MAAHAIWKGSISFGLVNIPIQVFSATQQEEYTSFSQLCDKGHKIRYKKWCPIEEREVQWSEIKKGYELTKNDYVVIEKEDFDKIKLKTNNTIEVKEFIEADEFDPISLKRTIMLDLILVRVIPKQVEEEPEETTDIIEALKASLKVKPKSSAKAKGKMGIAVSK